ncbi:MAG TPA: extracellular solute-binding protein [Galbitalea sp.]
MTRRSRRLLAATGLALAATVALAGCVSTGGTASTTAVTKDASGPLVLQSRFTGAEKAGLEAVIKAFDKKGEGKVQLNSLPTTTFDTQLPSYLTSKNPPDVYTWYAGQATRDFADQGLLLDLSDVWKKSLGNYSSALKTLSSTSKGEQVFVPSDYYWWGVYYSKSEFAKLGITPPKTWDDFLADSAKIKSQGVTPITMGLSDNSWLAAAWFDYLDLRINGAKYHLDLLAGKHSFDSAPVKKVFAAFKQVLPFLSPSVLGTSYNQSMSDLSTGKAGMYLAGAFLETAVPKATRSDLGFFQFPVIDPAVPVSEEAPTDGFMVSAKTTRPALAKRFLEFAAGAKGQSLLLNGEDGISLAVNPSATQTMDALSTQGKQMLQSASQVTQFFNRDAGDAQQTPADTALTQFIAQPNNLDAILTAWQASAVKLRSGS